MEERKKEHIELAFKSRIDGADANRYFNYEPMLSPHHSGAPTPISFAGKRMQLPVWVSSMTGGTGSAAEINRNLARVCAEYGMGMGLGSCRILLEDRSHWKDFDVRDIIGNEVPLFANIGIAQLEKMLKDGSWERIEELVHLLRSDGLIVHVNPLQEAFQPEGDIFEEAPINTISRFVERTKIPLIVKEVGQGMGPVSLKALLQLPLEAIEFGALGGTNFTLLELRRQENFDTKPFESFANVGHTASEMCAFINELVDSSLYIRTKSIIISGGISDVLEGYRLVRTCKMQALFGMGSGFLRYATGDYGKLKAFAEQLKKSLSLADAYLRLRQQPDK